jgi:hypothetical protein
VIPRHRWTAWIRLPDVAGLCAKPKQIAQRPSPVLLSGREGYTLHWKIYAVLIGLLSFWGYFDTGLSRIWDLIDYLVFLIMYAGLVSFSWNKVLFQRRFWQLFFPVSVLWNIAYMFFIPGPSPEDVQGSSQLAAASIVSLIFVLLISLPTFIALFLYAYKRDDLWK